MPAIRIEGRDYEEIAVRQIRGPVQTTVTSTALPTGAATEATLAQVRDAIKATIDLESTIWTDDSGAYYVRRDVVNEGTGVITISWTAPDGSSATPGAGLKPLSSAQRNVTQALFVATGSGAGYGSGDFLARLLILDVNANIPVATQVWYNLSTSAVITAPSAANVTPSDESIVVASSALPAGAATAANQTTTNSSLASLDSKLPGSLTVSATRLLVDGSGVTQPVSAASLPLPAGAATEANQGTGNTLLTSVDSKLPSGLTVSATRLLVDGSGVTQPVSAASLPLPTGAATSANQAVTNASLANIDGDLGATADAAASSDTGTFSLISLFKRGLQNWTTLLARLPSGLTVSATRLLVDGSGVTQPTSVAARTPVTTSVASSMTSGQILSSNASRKGFSISNISTAKLYLSFSSPATTGNCFIEVPAGAFLLLDQQLIVTGAIYGIWSSANGAAQVTEFV